MLIKSPTEPQLTPEPLTNGNQFHNFMEESLFILTIHPASHLMSQKHNKTIVYSILTIHLWFLVGGEENAIFPRQMLHTKSVMKAVFREIVTIYIYVNAQLMAKTDSDRLL